MVNTSLKPILQGRLEFVNHKGGSGLHPLLCPVWSCHQQRRNDPMSKFIYSEVHEIKVFHGTRHVGTIKLTSGMGVPAKYAYYPKGSKRRGEEFSTVEECKRS